MARISLDVRLPKLGIRRRLIRLLGGQVEDATAELQAAPEDAEPQVDGDDDDEGPFSFIMTPDGPIPVPPGVHPLQFLQHIVGQARERQESQRQAGPPPSPTTRTGPASQQFAMRVVDCIKQMDPAGDPEVQMLLSAGWEPFGVHKFSSFTGAEGVRVYFKRGHGRPQWPGGPMQAIDE